MRHWLPRFLIIASLGLHVLTAACYIRQPDMMAAVTVYPIWIWGLLGLFFAALAFVFWRARLSLILVVLWSLTILIASDEAHALARIGRDDSATRVDDGAFCDFDRRGDLLDLFRSRGAL